MLNKLIFYCAPLILQIRKSTGAKWNSFTNTNRATFLLLQLRIYPQEKTTVLKSFCHRF